MTANDRKSEALEGWLGSLEKLVPTPPEHTGDRVGRAEALGLLRCSESTLEALIARGLPSERSGSAQTFERADIYNVALWSGSDRSLPELGGLFVRRLKHEGVDRWTEVRRWKVDIELRCPRGADCAEGSWALGQPLSGRPDGIEPRWRIPGGAALLAGAIKASGVREVFAVQGSFATRGREQKVRSAALRDVFMAFVRSYRYQILSPSWAEDLGSARRAGVADCGAATGIVAEDCRDAGYEAEVRSGFLIGMFGFSGHRWVRVRDDDGDWKILDPTLPLLSTAGGEDPTGAAAAFARFCCGSTLNRILPCRTLDSGQLAEHSCGGDSLLPKLALRARAGLGSEDDPAR